MGNTQKIISNNIVRLREESGLSQSDLAEKLQIALGTLQGYEYQRRFPKPEILDRIAEYFNISIDSLFELKGFNKTSLNSFFDTISNNVELIQLLAKLPKDSPAFDMCKDIITGAIEDHEQDLQNRQNSQAR